MRILLQRSSLCAFLSCFVGSGAIPFSSTEGFSVDDPFQSAKHSPYMTAIKFWDDSRHPEDCRILDA
jgi:hypothetical protein